jgi:CHAD domain-containing protein
MSSVDGALEREVKLAPRPELDVGSLAGEALETRRFASTYYDSADRRLTRLGITLRRRVEHGQSLWQLKLPRSGGRIELERPGGPAAPPRRIASLLAAVLRDREIAPIAELHTVRRGVRMHSATSTADVVHDEVSVMEGLHVRSKFDEVEIELVEGDPRALREIERAVRRAGAKDADQRPKVFRAIGQTVHKTKPKRPQLQQFFERQYEQILLHDPGTRLGDDPEDLHDLRVAVRRLRAILKVAAPPLDAAWAESLRSELDWLGHALGPVRDLDVMLEHLREQQSRLSAADAAAFELIRVELERERAQSRRSLLNAMRTARYTRLLDRLEEAARRPRTRSARPSVQKIAAGQFGKLRKAVRALEPDPDDQALHKVRIKGKRARYAAELAQPATGREATKFVAAAKSFQDVTGAHQDAVVTGQRLCELAARSEPAGAFVAGRIAEIEESLKGEARGAFEAAWQKLERSGKRAWT